MPNRLYGEGPVLSLVHVPTSAAGVTAQIAAPLDALSLIWQVPPAPFSDGILIRRFAAFADTEVGSTATLEADLQVGATIAGAATILDGTVDFIADATAFSEGVLVSTDALSSTNPNIGGTPGTVVAAGAYVLIVFTAATVWTDAAHFGRVIAQIDYSPWNSVTSLVPGSGGA